MQEMSSRSIDISNLHRCLKQALLLSLNEKKIWEKQEEDEMHFACFILLVTTVTAGDVFDGEIDDTVKIQAFNFCSRTY